MINVNMKILPRVIGKTRALTYRSIVNWIRNEPAVYVTPCSRTREYVVGLTRKLYVRQENNIVVAPYSNIVDDKTDISKAIKGAVDKARRQSMDNEIFIYLDEYDSLGFSSKEGIYKTIKKYEKENPNMTFHIFIYTSPKNMETIKHIKLRQSLICCAYPGVDEEEEITDHQKEIIKFVLRTHGVNRNSFLLEDIADMDISFCYEQGNILSGNTEMDRNNSISKLKKEIESCQEIYNSWLKTREGIQNEIETY